MRAAISARIFLCVASRTWGKAKLKALLQEELKDVISG
jgi:hypothetical protein